MAITLNPYIHFDGNAEEVANFYKGIFGGELTINRFGDFDSSDVGEEFKNQVMHADLKTDELRLMISDSGPMGAGKVGDNISISLSGFADDKEKLTGYFDALSDGGNVTVALETHPWGATFGMVTDKYGIHWLVNIDQQAS